MMDAKCRAVLDAVMELSEAERSVVVGELIATLSPGMTFSTDDELADELERRFDEALNDPTSTVSWSELRDRKP